VAKGNDCGLAKGDKVYVGMGLSIFVAFIFDSFGKMGCLRGVGLRVGTENK